MSNTRRFRRSRPFGIGPLALALVGTQMASCACSSEFRACATPDSCAAGASGDRGIASGGGEQGGMPVGGSGGAGTAGNGGNGEAGDAGAAGCADVCKGTTPVCDTTSNICVQCVKSPDCKDNAKPVCDAATNTCVQCTKGSDCSDATKPACDAGTNSCVECVGNGDCKDSTKPLCETTGAHCVACLKQADCTSPTASACNANVCTACTTDAECSNIAGKGVCDAGTCVQCTIAKESVCGGKSCNPSTRQCTATAVATVDLCGACVADSECIGSGLDPDARCVPMKFMGSPRANGFCLRRESKTCSSPYAIPLDGISLSGAATDTYCGIDQNATRCEAVLDFLDSRTCADANDSSCGCTRDKNGTCLDSGQGGLCRKVLTMNNKCTIPCGNTVQCTSATTCPSVNYCH